MRRAFETELVNPSVGNDASSLRIHGPLHPNHLAIGVPGAGLRSRSV